MVGLIRSDANARLVQVGLLVLACCAAASMAVARLAAPWDIHNNGWAGAFYSLIALTRLQNGALDVLAPQALEVGSSRLVYLNHRLDVRGVWCWGRVLPWISSWNRSSPPSRFRPSLRARRRGQRFGAGVKRR